VRIEITADGRRALTTDQAVEAGAGKWRNAASLRAWIARHHIAPAAELNARTKLYFPEDLGLETPK
jgi:hypothetical protein